MTYAPADLLAVRQFLVDATPLDGDDVGIVGDPAHMAGGGAHLGNDDLARIGKLNTDYTKRESPRDRPGSNAASAIDIGEWSGKAGAAGISWIAFNRELAAACQRGDPRTADVREVIYTPDGSTVRRFDRLGIRTTGDSSHLFHTHISFFRDSEGRRARPDNILGLIQALIEGDDGMTPEEHDLLLNAAFRLDAMWFGSATVRGGAYPGSAMWIVGAVQRLEAAAAADAARDAAAKVAIDALATALVAGGGSVDSAAVIARINEVAAAESATVAELRAEVADLRARLAASAQAAADAYDA